MSWFALFTRPAPSNTAKPEIYEALEERGVKYAIRIPSNDSLERDINELLTRPVGRPSQKPVVWYKGFLYDAASWKTARLSCHRFRSNEVRLWLSVMGYNLVFVARQLVRFC